MAALSCTSKGCSAFAWGLQIDLGLSATQKCSARRLFHGGYSSRHGRYAALLNGQRRQGADEPQSNMQRERTWSNPGVVGCALRAGPDQNAESQTDGCSGQHIADTDGRLLEKQHPSRRDLLLLTSAVGLAIAQPANAEDNAAPPNEVTSATTPAQAQSAPPPSELQNPAPATKPADNPPPAEAPAAKQAPKPAGPNTTVTARAYLDIMLCPGGTSRSDRTLGDSNNICTPESGGEMLGRIVIGLYGKQVPRTVANFIAMVTGAAGSTYKGTLFHKIIAGQYIQAGKQGSRSEGQVLAPTNLEKNPETVKSSAFALPHRRPGTVSLCLGVNDDEEDRKLSEDYRNVEFLITTGPGPASDLDGSNIVFGTVLEGMDVVSRIAAVPSYQPNIRIKQFNELAEFLGDERAETARKFWDRPLQNVVISGCGIIQPKPSPLPNGQP